MLLQISSSCLLVIIWYFKIHGNFILVSITCLQICSNCYFFSHSFSVILWSFQPFLIWLVFLICCHPKHSLIYIMLFVIILEMWWLMLLIGFFFLWVVTLAFYSRIVASFNLGTVTDTDSDYISTFGSHSNKNDS
jgi:hypothetical protein